jgi:hypothetical protein
MDQLEDEGIHLRRKMIDESREKEALMIWALFILTFCYYRPVMQ